MTDWGVFFSAANGFCSTHFFHSGYLEESNSGIPWRQRRIAAHPALDGRQERS